MMCLGRYATVVYITISRNRRRMMSGISVKGHTEQNGRVDQNCLWSWERLVSSRNHYLSLVPRLWKRDLPLPIAIAIDCV